MKLKVEIAYDPKSNVSKTVCASTQQVIAIGYLSGKFIKALHYYSKQVGATELENSKLPGNSTGLTLGTCPGNSTHNSTISSITTSPSQIADTKRLIIIICFVTVFGCCFFCGLAWFGLVCYRDRKKDKENQNTYILYDERPRSGDERRDGDDGESFYSGSRSFYDNSFFDLHVAAGGKRNGSQADDNSEVDQYGIKKLKYHPNHRQLRGNRGGGGGGSLDDFQASFDGSDTNNGAAGGSKSFYNNSFLSFYSQNVADQEGTLAVIELNKNKDEEEGSRVDADDDKMNNSKSFYNNTHLNLSLYHIKGSGSQSGSQNGSRSRSRDEDHDDFDQNSLNSSNHSKSSGIIHPRQRGLSKQSLDKHQQNMAASASYYDSHMIKEMLMNENEENDPDFDKYDGISSIAEDDDLIILPIPTHVNSSLDMNHRSSYQKNSTSFYDVSFLNGSLLSSPGQSRSIDAYDDRKKKEQDGIDLEKGTAVQQEGSTHPEQQRMKGGSYYNTSFFHLPVPPALTSGGLHSSSSASAKSFHTKTSNQDGRFVKEKGFEMGGGLPSGTEQYQYVQFTENEVEKEVNPSLFRNSTSLSNGFGSGSNDDDCSSITIDPSPRLASDQLQQQQQQGQSRPLVPLNSSSDQPPSDTKDLVSTSASTYGISFFNVFETKHNSNI
jgi:hypothetical protein